MTDQTPDPWTLMVQKWRGDAGVLRAAANPISASDMEAAKMEEGAATLLYCAEQVGRALAAERAQHQQALIDQRVIGHAEGQAHAIADVNAGRIDDLIALRLAQHQQEIAQRDETIRQPQDAFARCQEVQQATAETWRIEHDQMAEQIRLLRGAMAADDERLRRAAEQAGILYVSCDTAEALAEQIARLSAEVEEQRSFEILMIKDATRLEAARDEAVSEAAILRAERDAAQQQIATLTQELSESRANHIDANQRNMQSVRELEAAEARCATLQGAVAADEERLRQAAARAGVLFVGCDTADALADRCATLTAALKALYEAFDCEVVAEGCDAQCQTCRAITAARAALQSTRPQEQKLQVHRMRWQPRKGGLVDAHCACGVHCSDKVPEAVQQWFEAHLAATHQQEGHQP